MKVTIPKIVISAGALFLILSVVILHKPYADGESVYSKGSRISNFTLPGEYGKKISLSQFKGKVIILEFYGYY